MMYLSELKVIVPEAILLGIILILLICGVLEGTYKKGISFANIVWWNGILGVLLVLMLCINQYKINYVIFNGALYQDIFVYWLKIVIMGVGLILSIMGVDYVREEKLRTYEIVVLMLLWYIGMLVLVSANDFMSMYVTLELQNLSMYVLVGYKRWELRSSEAGLKFVILSAFSSGLLLFGIAIVYGVTGITNFDDFASLYLGTSNIEIGWGGLLLGLSFIMVGLLFKLSAAPFHVYVPDIYDGAPTYIVGLLTTLSKVIGVVLMIRIFMVIFGGLVNYWQVSLLVCGITSLIIGVFGALYQVRIKRLIGYSTITHVGFLALGFSAGGIDGIISVLLYLLVYILLSINLFGLLVNIRSERGEIILLKDVSYMRNGNIIGCVSMMLTLISLAGVPPLSGFYSKFFVLVSVVNIGMYYIGIVAVLFTVISSIYYLRLFVLMIIEKEVGWLKYNEVSRSGGYIIVISMLLNILFIGYLDVLYMGIEYLVISFI